MSGQVGMGVGTLMKPHLLDMNPQGSWTDAGPGQLYVIAEYSSNSGKQVIIKRENVVAYEEMSQNGL